MTILSTYTREYFKREKRQKIIRQIKEVTLALLATCIAWVLGILFLVAVAAK